MQENTDQNNSEYGYFSCSAIRMIDLTLFVCAIEIESNTIQSSIENIISIQQ